MRAIDRENLKTPGVNMTNPTGNVCGLSSPWIHVRVSVGREPRLTDRKLVKRTEGEPGCIPRSANQRRKQVACNRQRHNHCHDPIKKKCELKEHPTSGNFAAKVH